MAKGDIPNTNNMAPMSSVNQKMVPSGNQSPLWQQLANMNLNYPTSVVQQPPMAMLNPYSGSSYGTGAGGSSMSPSQSVYDMLGMSPQTQNYMAMMNPSGAYNSPTSQMANSAFSSSMAPSQNLMAQYFSQLMSPYQAPGNNIGIGGSLSNLLNGMGNTGVNGGGMGAGAAMSYNDPSIPQAMSYNSPSSSTQVMPQAIAASMIPQMGMGNQAQLSSISPSASMLSKVPYAQ